MHVHHTGSEPSLFKDCAPVVAEGHWSAPGSTTFDSTRLLIKHGNDYEAPKSTGGPRSCARPIPSSHEVAARLRPAHDRLRGCRCSACSRWPSGSRRNRPRLLDVGRRYVLVCLVAAVGAFVVMETALFGHDFSIQYVADNVARATPGLYTFTAAWSALEGSILLWALLLSIYVAATAWRFRDRAADPLVAWATLVQYAVLLFFFALMLFAANPFKQVSGVVPLDGRGPNPLLQNHPLVAIHPPMLYAGLVGFTIPFSFAIAALVTGRFGEGWLAAVRRTTLVAWGFLTVGIVLGAWWSYAVLGWGGYLGLGPGRERVAAPVAHRDRVHPLGDGAGAARDAARLEPVARDRDVLPHDPRHVPHPFGRHQLGARLLAVEHRSVAADVPRRVRVRPASVSSRGGATSCARPAGSTRPSRAKPRSCSTTCCSPAFALVVLTGTVFPLLVEALQDRQITVGEPYFARLGAPIGIALLFLMAVGPALPWRAASGELLRRRLLVPAWVGGITLVVCVIAGMRGIANVLAFALGAFTLTSVGRSVLVGVRARRRAHPEERVPRATMRTVRGNPRLYGGLIVHVGVVVIAVALATTGGLDHEARAEPRSGAVGDGARPQGDVRRARSSSRPRRRRRSRRGCGSTASARSRPRSRPTPASSDGIGTPSMHTDPLHDWYLTLVSAPTSGRVTIGVQVGTMVMWLWIGGLIMAFGTMLALMPVRRRVRGRVIDDVSLVDDDEPAPLAEVST